MFHITKHVRERYLERMRPRYRYLTEHGMDGEDPRTIQLLIARNKEIKKNRKQIDEEIRLLLEESTVERSHRNNSEIMLYMYERYGYDRNFNFLVNGKATFVVIEEGTQRVVVTVLDSFTHICGKIGNRPKYKKKPLLDNLPALQHNV